MAQESAPGTPSPRPRRRRLLRTALILALLGGSGLVAALPTLLSTPPGRAWLLARVNQRLAPGHLGLGGLRLAWFRPIELTGLSLADPDGKRVLAAGHIRLDRGLLALATSPRNLGTIRIDDAEVAIRRRDDGSINLLDALQGLNRPSDRETSSGPGVAVVVEIQGRSLHLDSPELVEPITSGSFEGRVALAPGKPAEFDLALADDGCALKVGGHWETDTGAAGQVRLKATRWPLAIRNAGFQGRSRLDGTLEAIREASSWKASGKLELADLDVGGTALAGDRLRLDRTTAKIDLQQTEQGWNFPGLELHSPVGAFTVAGSIPSVGAQPLKLDGAIDLAALAAQLPRALRLREDLVIDRGTARISANLTETAEGETLDIKASLENLAAHEAGRPVELREPPTITGRIVRRGDSIAVESLVARATGIDAKGSGDLDKGVSVSGHIDLAALRAELHTLLDLKGIDATGRVGLAADYRRAGATYQARFAAESRNLVVTGLTAEPFHREMVRLDASAIGNRTEGGLPRDWQTARLGLKAGEAHADIAATVTPNAVQVKAQAATVVSSPAPGKAEVSTTLRWSGSALAIDDLLVQLVPKDARTPSVLGFHTKGRVDLKAGQARFEPIAGATTGSIGLGPEGLTIAGIGRDDVPLRIDAGLSGDLAALDELLAALSSTPARGLKGTWTAQLAVAPRPGSAYGIGGHLKIAHLATPAPQGPVDLQFRGEYRAGEDRLAAAAIDLTTRLGRLAAKGDVAELSSRRLASLEGTLEPRWDIVEKTLTDAVGSEAKLAAQVRPFRLSGPLVGSTASEILRSWQGDLGLDIRSADILGLKIGPAPVVLHLNGGRAVFDPIQATLNGGTMALNGDLALDDPNALWLRLGAGSKIDHAAINEVVAAGLLAYVAPILGSATEVLGHVSATFDRAAFPLVGPGSTEIVGHVVFDDVVFQPGAFATELLTMTGQRVPRLRLHQPVQLQVANGRVRQSGLSIALGGDAKLDLAGSVGFDQTLKLRATLPVTARMLGRDDLLEQLAAGTRLTVPISGTLEKPGIDRQAFQVALRDAARSVAKRGLEAGAERLLNEVARPESEAPARPGTPKKKNALKILEGLGRELLEPK